MSYPEKGRSCLGHEGRGKLYRLTIKLTSFQTIVKDFPFTLRVTSNDSFKSIASHKKFIFLKNVLWITLQCHET